MKFIELVFFALELWKQRYQFVQTVVLLCIHHSSIRRLAIDRILCPLFRLQIIRKHLERRPDQNVITSIFIFIYKFFRFFFPFVACKWHEYLTRIFNKMTMIAWLNLTAIVLYCRNYNNYAIYILYVNTIKHHARMQWLLAQPRKHSGKEHNFEGKAASLFFSYFAQYILM